MTVPKRKRCECGRPTYTTSVRDGQPRHPCCERAGAGTDPSFEDCASCLASDAADRKWETTGKQWARRVKDFWTAEAERQQEGRT